MPVVVFPTEIKPWQISELQTIYAGQGTVLAQLATIAADLNNYIITSTGGGGLGRTYLCPKCKGVGRYPLSLITGNSADAGTWVYDDQGCEQYGYRATQGQISAGQVVEQI